jgi:peptidoglycan/LPS O-acetylase OafA/YrhL
MPGTDAGSGLQISLSAGGRRYDLAVPVGAQVTEVLSVLGIASRANPHAVATPSGRILGPLDIFDESVPTGSILSVVPVTTHAVTRDILNLDRGRSAGGARSSAPAGSGGRHREPAEPVPARADVDESTRRRGAAPTSEVSETTTPRSGLVTVTDARRTPRTRTRAAPPSMATQLIWLAAALGAVVSLVAAWSLARSSATAPTTVLGQPTAWMPTVAAALLAAGAIGLAALSSRRSHRFAAAATAPALGLAAGLTLPWPSSPGRASVAVVAGCAVGVLALAITRTRVDADSPGDRTVLATIGGLGLLVGIGTVLDWPGHSTAAVVTGLGPLLMRLLPSTSLVVDANQLVDTDRLSTTIWSVRERSAGRRKRVTDSDVRARFDAAREIVAIGTAYLSLTVAVTGWLAVTTPAPDTTSRWGTLAVVVVAALACGYQSRTVRDRLPRYSTLGACAALLLAGAHALLTSGWDGGPVLLFLVATGIAWISVVSATALGQGYRSTRMSRFADTLEGLTVALSVPLGVVAAGGVEALRRMTSG